MDLLNFLTADEKRAVYETLKKEFESKPTSEEEVIKFATEEAKRRNLGYMSPNNPVPGIKL